MEDIGSYEDIKEKIIKNQQLLQFQQEIIYIAILLGLLINISSSLIYDTLLSNYENRLIVLPIAFALIIIIFYILFKHIIKPDSEIKILNFTYNPFFVTPYDGGINNEIKNQLMKNGISKTEFNLFYRRVEHAIKKIISDGKMYNIGNKIHEITMHESDIKEIVIDTSKNGVKSYMSILIKPQAYPPFFKDEDEKTNDYYTVFIEVNVYLSDPRNEKSLDFFKDIFKRKEQIFMDIKSVFLLTLAYNMNLTGTDHMIYNLIKYFEIEKIQ